MKLPWWSYVVGVVLLLFGGKYVIATYFGPSDEALVKSALAEAVKASKEGRPGGVLDHITDHFKMNSDIPGNINIAKRYAVHFGLIYDPESVWLTAPRTKDVDVAFHCPLRRSVRSADDWREILADLVDDGLKIAVVDQENADEWKMIPAEHPNGDLLESADYINSAKVFLGTVSCCNAIAEGLKKPRLVEQAPDCFNVNVPEGGCINGWSNEQVVEQVRALCRP